MNDLRWTALCGADCTASVVEHGEGAVTSQPAATSDLARDTDIDTTLEELEGYQIVKAIACSEVKPQRVVHRDGKSYLAVLLDDNNRKPRHQFESLDDIYQHAAHIREAVRGYAS